MSSYQPRDVTAGDTVHVHCTASCLQPREPQFLSKSRRGVAKMNFSKDVSFSIKIISRQSIYTHFLYTKTYFEHIQILT